MIYDFHMHTTLSDGSLPPEEVVALAKEAKVDVMCLTDHDTLLSMDIADKLNKKEKNIEVLGGLEISTHMTKYNRHAHILAYRCDRNNKALNELVNTTISRRTSSFYKSIEKINQRADVHIDTDEIEKYKGVNGFYKQHILKYLVDIGYAKEIHGETRKKLFNRTHGYAFVGFEYPECTKAIEIVRNAGGVPILAHTFYSDNFCGIEDLIDAGLMGIEVYHPKHNTEQRKKLVDFCNSRNLLISCGSDFHGVFSETDTKIGKTSVDNEKIREFLSFIKK